MIKVINEPPYLKDRLRDKTVLTGTSIDFDLPDIIDKENQVVSVKVSLQGRMPLPDFIKFNGKTFTIDP